MALPSLKVEVPGQLAGELGRLLLLCLVVGLIAGLGAIAFYWLLAAARFLLLDLLAGYRPPGPGGELVLFGPTSTPLRRWALVLLPAAGGLLSGLIVYRFAPEAAGHGTDAAIEAYHHRDGDVRARVPLVKAVASAITIGSGGSGGREGPIAQIGAGVGSLLASRLKLPPATRRTLMAAGMSAGIGAIFHAPLAGALFAAEVLYKDADLEHEVLVPAFISSIVAYSLFASKFGWSPIFFTPDFVFDNPAQLLPYSVLALVVAAGAVLFIRLFYALHGAFARLKLPRPLRPALGGLLTGAVGFFVPQALSTSYDVLQRGLAGELGIGLLLAVAGAKMLTTSFSIGSGGSGGVFGPSVVIGGALGGAVGLVGREFLPGLGIDPGAFVLVGMAGFFAAAAHCPLSTVIMASEMTGNYHLLVPSLLVCTLAFLLARNHTLYRNQLPSRLDAPTKMGNMLTAVLGKIPVHQALGRIGPDGRVEGLVTIPEGLTLGALIARFSEADQTCFPVLNDGGRLMGVIDGRDVRRALGEEGVAELVVARDLMRRPEVVHAEETLLTAVRRLNLTGASELVVVDPADASRPIATLGRHAILKAYDSALIAPPTAAGWT